MPGEADFRNGELSLLLERVLRLHLIPRAVREWFPNRPNVFLDCWQLRC